MQIPKAVVCVDSIVRTHDILVWNMLYNSHCYCFVATAYSTVGIRHERTLSADSRSSQPRLTYVLPCSAQKKLKTQKRYEQRVVPAKVTVILPNWEERYFQNGQSRVREPTMSIHFVDL